MLNRHWRIQHFCEAVLSEIQLLLLLRRRCHKRKSVMYTDGWSQRSRFWSCTTAMGERAPQDHDRSTPSVFLAWTIFIAVRSPVQSCSRLFHTRLKAAWWPLTALVASEKRWPPGTPPHSVRIQREGPSWAATLSSQSLHVVKPRPWGTRVPPALLKSGTAPRCRTGPPVRGTSPPSQRPIPPRSWTAETSWPAAADTTTHELGGLGFFPLYCFLKHFFSLFPILKHTHTHTQVTSLKTLFG